MLVAAVAAYGLAGCSSDVIDSEHARRISRERITLLKRQPTPRCEYRTAGLDDAARRRSDAVPAPSETDADAAMRTKLDYERQCYKHAEMIARARLTSLQVVVQKAAKRSEGSNSSP